MSSYSVALLLRSVPKTARAKPLHVQALGLNCSKLRCVAAQERTGADMDMLFALSDAHLDRTLALVDVADLAHLRQLSKAWRRRITTFPRFIVANMLAVALPNILRQLENDEDARRNANLANARLVSKQWFDAVSNAATVKRTYAERDVLADAFSWLETAPDEPAVHVPRTRMSWLQ
jgi:hypothetical protein